MVAQKVPSSSLRSLAEENKRLKRAVEELSMLNDLARTIGASVNSNDIMKKIIHRSLRAVHAEQGVITLVDPKAKQSMKTLVRTMVSSSEQQPFHFNQNLLGWMYLNKKPLLINDAQRDERFRGVKWDKTINSLICIPLMIKSELIGVLTVYNKKEGKKFTEEDQRLLTIIAAQSAQVIDNARLYEEEQALFRMQEEVKLAYKIQLDLLPKTSPQITNYDIAGKSKPAQNVGGDYFDFITITKHRLAICLGDVSGKGMPAALLMANLQATIRGQTLINTSAKDCLCRSNTLLFQSTNPEKFVTLFYGILDTKKHLLYFSNAGHDAPLLFSENQAPIRLKTGGLVLGILEDFPFEEEVIPFNPGDLLVLYSDGITEAINSREEEFGQHRLEAVVKKHQEDSAGEIIEKIIAAVKLHVGDSPQIDDMTLVVIKRAKK